MESRDRFPALMLVVLAHGLLGLALLRLSAWPWRSPVLEATQPLRVQVLAPEVSPARDSRRLSTDLTSMPQAPAMALPFILVDPDSRAQEEASAIRVPTSTPSASAPETGSLDLRLRRQAVPLAGTRQQALDDPRANSAQPTVESRIADAVGGTGPVTIEDLGGGRRRLRQGNRCVEVHDARIASIDPFNESVRPSPKQAKACQ